MKCCRESVAPSRVREEALSSIAEVHLTRPTMPRINMDAAKDSLPPPGEHASAHIEQFKTTGDSMCRAPQIHLYILRTPLLLTLLSRMLR
jgi:hypothetical protein